MKNYIGVDIGGTNIRAARVSSAGEILELVVADSLAKASAEVIMENMIKTIQRLAIDQETVGIGIGIPGPVDTKAGRITLATNIPALKGYPIIEKIEQAFGLPTFMDNDANVAGLAEALVGAGVGYDSVYYITHSTGIGGAFISAGKVISGRLGYAGEIGNLIIKDTNEEYSGLSAGAVESEASGPAILRKAQQRIDPNIKDTKTVFELKAAGNYEAQAIITEMARDFARMLSYISLVVDPHVYVIGGGVSKSADAYLAEVIASFKALVHDQMDEVPFKLASLQEPGIIGAAMLPKSQGL